MNQYQTQARAIAISVWDCEQDADEFLSMPHSLLDDRAPIDVASTEAGAKRVEEILNKIRWGLPR